MTITKGKEYIAPEFAKKKINWTEYFDYSMFPMPAEIDNPALSQYIEDFKIKKIF